MAPPVAPLEPVAPHVAPPVVEPVAPPVVEPPVAEPVAPPVVEPVDEALDAPPPVAEAAPAEEDAFERDLEHALDMHNKECELEEARALVAERDATIAGLLADAELREAELSALREKLVDGDAAAKKSDAKVADLRKRLRTRDAVVLARDAEVAALQAQLLDSRLILQARDGMLEAAFRRRPRVDDDVAAAKAAKARAEAARDRAEAQVVFTEKALRQVRTELTDAMSLHRRRDREEEAKRRV